LLLRYFDLYQRLQLQFYVLLMIGAMDTRNMWSDFAVNKYLHTVASCWILLIYKKVSYMNGRPPHCNGLWIRRRSQLSILFYSGSNCTSNITFSKHRNKGFYIYKLCSCELTMTISTKMNPKRRNNKIKYYITPMEWKIVRAFNKIISEPNNILKN